MAYSGPTKLSSSETNTTVSDPLTATHTVTQNGSTVIVVVSSSSNTANITGISGGGYTWTTHKNVENSVSGRWIACFQADNVSAGGLTVSCPSAAAPTYGKITVIEFTPCTLDVVEHFEITSTVTTWYCADSPGITSAANAFVMAALTFNASPGTITIPTGYTGLVSDHSASPYIADIAYIQSETGVANDRGTFSGTLSRNSIGFIISLTTASSPVTSATHGACNFFNCQKYRGYRYNIR